MYCREQRFKIADGTSKGLNYLHSQSIFHGNIESSNIFLDEYFEPKIGNPYGFGQLNECVEYYPSNDGIIVQSRNAIDTHCFGMFLFELVTGKLLF